MAQSQHQIRKIAKDLLATDYSGAPAVIRRLLNASDRARLLYVCARAYMSDWRLPEALALSEESIATQGTTSAYLLCSEIHSFIGNPVSAIECAKAASALDPLDATSIQQLKSLSAPEADKMLSVDEISTEIEHRDRAPEAIFAATRLLIHYGRCTEAISFLASALDAFQEEDFVAEMNFWHGYALENQRRFAQALHHYAQCKQGKMARRSLKGTAICLMELGHHEEAEQVFNKIHELDGKPGGFDSSWRGLKLRQGQFKEAWLSYRRREISTALRNYVGGRYCQSLTSLADVAEVLLLAEGGPGDEICFASTYPELVQRLRNLTVTCEPRLSSLLARNFPSVRFLSVARWRPQFPGSYYAQCDRVKRRILADFINNDAQHHAERVDAFCSVFDVLADLRPDVEAFPRRQKYLNARPDLVDTWRGRIAHHTFGNLPQVALSWRSLLRDVRRDAHYLGASDFSPLADLPAEFWLFQPCLEPQETTVLKRLLPKVHVPEGLDMRDDFEGMAAFLANMDFVVSPCTTNAELAGALGVRTLLFVGTEAAKWRKQEDESDLWHANVRIVSGTPLGDRASTAAAIRDALDREITAAVGDWLSRSA